MDPIELIGHIPMEYLYGLSFILLILGLYFSLTRPRRYVEYTILTTIISPIPSIIALYNMLGYTFLFQIVLIGYSIIILSVSLPTVFQVYAGGIREIYADTKRYYLVWLSKSGTMEFVNPDRFATQMTNYTYLLILVSPFIALPLYWIGYMVYGFLILVGVFILIILMPYITVSVGKASYKSNLLDEFPQVLQLFLIHHRAGETVIEVFKNISRNEENLPAWSKLTKSLLVRAEMSGHGLDRILSEWVESGHGPEKIRNFIEGYLYTWLAGGNIEAYISRWMEDEEALWINRISGYYSKMLIFAEIAIMAAVSPIAILLLAFLNPDFGTLFLQLLIILLPLTLYIIPMIYMSSVRPRMASTPSYIPNPLILIATIVGGLGLSYVLFHDIYSRLVVVLLVVFLAQLPLESRWHIQLKRIEDGILRWLETAMHYMLAGSMPLDAIQKAKRLITEPNTARLINRFSYNIESGQLRVRGPTPFITHMLHLVGTGIMTGSLSPELLYMNVNILYKIRNTIEESRRSVYPAIMLWVLTPFLILLTIGVGVWFVNTIMVLNPAEAAIPIPFPFISIRIEDVIPILYLFAIVLSLTIGSIVSSTYSNYFYNSYIHTPILLSLLVTIILGIDYFVELFRGLLGVSI